MVVIIGTDTLGLYTSFTIQSDLVERNRKNFNCNYPNGQFMIGEIVSASSQSKKVKSPASLSSFRIGIDIIYAAFDQD